MAQDRYEAMIRAYLEDVFNGHNLLGLDKYMGADTISHWLSDRTLHGMQAWKEGMEGFFTAFPDAAYTLNDHRGPRR